ncbi:MAG TPA: preprotein translocase subunit YajC [Lachnoclostridium phytofermentans]|uniref:Preprotein translocase subunit YajC n=1 Tax=Lachnoclostridium phytofermentans TaxID=66219 RepID=A0A3D2X6S3_9FIRM|nr:preprotein translocase subunit YajC [Lachnoclostridium sp.]HCL02417.1 preprotein translocase subunit YajC [Lachnoclostridium phytofermentans]
MNQLVFLADAGATGGAMSWTWMIGYIIIIGGLFYFMAIRPQKKQQKQMNALISSLEIGDSVLTTSGFYGVVIDVMDDVIIVEFGNNKNCRIPMKKSAVVEVEKPGSEENK